MDVAELNTFIAVAESGSFSIAAEHLFITQPAVSKRISALERELDTRLFDRIGRNVVLTESGRTLLPRAKSILSQLEDSRRALSRLKESVAGPLLIGTSHHIGLHRLPGVLTRFTRDFPDVDLDIRFLDSEAVCGEVEDGRLELGVVTLPPEEMPQLQLIPIWDDPLILMFGRDHPLSRLQTPIECAELAQYPAILPGRETYTRRVVESAFTQRQIDLKVQMSTNYLETIKMLVSIGMGWSILPATLMGEGVISRTISDLNLTRRLGIVVHRNRSRSNAADALIEILRNG